MYACSIDGRLCTGAEASVPVDDHGLLYGDGVFEGLRFYNRCIFRLDAHLARLEESAKAIGLDMPYDRGDIAAMIDGTVAAAGLDDGYVRLVITRGSGSMGIDTESCVRPRTIVIVDELVMVSPDKRRSGINVIVSSIRRLGPDQLDPGIKSLNYLNQVLARKEARARGADEAILLNQQGFVAEGSADNVFIVRDGSLVTPPVTDGALNGVTRGVVLALAIDAAISASERSITPRDLITADECFLTGTGVGLIPVAAIDDSRLPARRPVFDTLMRAFTTLVRHESTPAMSRN